MILTRVVSAGRTGGAMEGMQEPGVWLFQCEWSVSVMAVAGRGDVLFQLLDRGMVA